MILVFSDITHPEYEILFCSCTAPPCSVYVISQFKHISCFNCDVFCFSGVIAVVIFVIVVVLAVTARFLYRRKETYQNQEVKGVKQEDSQDFPYNNQADPQSVSTESPKDFFM